MIDLPDGSTAVVEAHGLNHSSVTRYVDGVPVWGQHFGRTDDHAGQVAEVLAAMQANPVRFRRWWL